MKRRGIATVLCALILGLTIFSFQSEIAVVSADEPSDTPLDEEEDGNETIGEGGSNLTGQGLRYPGYNFPSIPRTYYREPPFYVEGIVNITLKSTGDFDPLVQVPDPPLGLRTEYGWFADGHYLIQFTGPPRAEWLDEVKDLGAVFYGYIPHYAYMIQIDNYEFVKLASKDYVRWLGVYHAGYKIPPFFQSIVGNETPMKMLVLVYEDSHVPQVILQLLSLGVVVDDKGGNMIHVTTSPSMVPKIARIEKVFWIEWNDGVATFGIPFVDVNQEVGDVEERPSRLVDDECGKQECTSFPGVLGILLLPLIVTGMICAALGASYSAYKALSKPEKKRA